MMKRKYYNTVSQFLIPACILLILMVACKSRGEQIVEPEIVKGTPVTITSISNGPMTETLTLHATATFLVKTNINPSTTGYIEYKNLQVGQFIHSGDVVFQLRPKESTAIGNTISKLDSSFHFNNSVAIKSNSSGYISAINFQSGDYVQEGDPVITISEASSFVFLLDMPFELKKYIPANNKMDVELPGGEHLKGYLRSAMPTVDMGSQTQQYQLIVSSDKMIPENLIATVTMVKASKTIAITLPKAAVLSNETLDNFWVMKMINDSLAVKVPVTKGIESHDLIEIVSPVFSKEDKILITGNYGLPDTALVVIIKK